MKLVLPEHLAVLKRNNESKLTVNRTCYAGSLAARRLDVELDKKQKIIWILLQRALKISKSGIRPWWAAQSIARSF